MNNSRKMFIAVIAIAVLAAVIGQSSSSIAQTSTLTLPLSATCGFLECLDGEVEAFRLIQEGASTALYVQIDNNQNAAPAIWGDANSPSTGGSAVFGLQRGFADGGSFAVENAQSFGKALFARSTGLGPTAQFIAENGNNAGPALSVIRTGTGVAAQFEGGDVVAVGGSFISDGTVLNVPDYVFGDDYDLMTLEEIAEFIDANSHLPNVPSAADVAANGLNHSEFTLSILEKVEELTLHTIAMNDVIKEQQAQIEALTQLVNQLTLSE